MTPTPEPLSPRDAFLADASKRARLYAVLRDPVIEEAIAIAEDMLRPRVGTAADANQPLSIAKFHQSAGANAFVQNLCELTREKKAPVKLTPRKLAESPEDLPPIPE